MHRDVDVGLFAAWAGLATLAAERRERSVPRKYHAVGLASPKAL